MRTPAAALRPLIGLGDVPPRERRLGAGYGRASVPPISLRQSRPKCGARCRTGKPCRAPVVWDKANNRARNQRCRMHGGLSTGPRTEAGRQRIREAQKKRWDAYRQKQADEREAAYRSHWGWPESHVIEPGYLEVIRAGGDLESYRSPEPQQKRKPFTPKPMTLAQAQAFVNRRTQRWI